MTIKRLGNSNFEVEAAQLAVLLSKNPAMLEYVPRTTPLNLTDSAANFWNGTFSAAVGTYTFRPQDNSNAWPVTARAVILFINGQWGAASGSNAMSVRQSGGTINELQVRAYVASIGIVEQGIVMLNIAAGGYFEVIIAGATNTNGLVRFLGYLR